MRVVAYCRVSTNKDEQLDSLETQQKFFAEYAAHNRQELVDIYADEGKSGTKMKNRTQLLRLLSDAGQNRFDAVLIKDVSRLARNTVDFLTSIRQLKALGVRVVFVNYDQTSSDSSEFMLTMLSAIAQEESANTSKRVKFGKKMNAEKGRVPNLVYGYDKVPGTYFALAVNEPEAAAVRRIFDWYAGEEMGAGKIACELNRRGLMTKRGCRWSQNGVTRILTNPLYTGKIMNGKEEVADFLTGRRIQKEKEHWFVTDCPALAIVDTAVFDKAQALLESRRAQFQATGKRKSEKQVFSKLICCAHCHSAFRRLVRHYKNTYIRWVCSGRSSKGTSACPNGVSVDEDALLEAICSYFAGILRSSANALERLRAEYLRLQRTGDYRRRTQKDLAALKRKTEKARQRQLEMYEADIITLEELKARTADLNDTLRRLARELDTADGVETAPLPPRLASLEAALAPGGMDHALIAGLIETIEVEQTGRIHVYLRQFSSRAATVPLSDNGS